MVGCSDGVQKYTALVLWGVYNTIVAIILLNLLIAMMSGAMDEMTTYKVASWKYNSTQVWLDYCDDSILPSPLNLFDILLDFIIAILCTPCKLCCREDADEKMRKMVCKIKRKEKYKELVKTLTVRYASQVLNGGNGISLRGEDEGGDEGGIDLEPILRDFKKTIEDKNEEIKKEINELRWTISELLEKAAIANGSPKKKKK